MKTLKAQVIISLITCFFLVLAVTICKGNKFGNILSESENTTESQTLPPTVWAALKIALAIFSMLKGTWRPSRFFIIVIIAIILIAPF